MIISASRRTDIPAFYSDWMLGRLRDGQVMTRNPFNPAQTKLVSLRREDVDCIVFWTKDPAPLLERLGEVEQGGGPVYFQVTLTPYGRELEAYLRDKGEIEKTFLVLSKRIGRERVRWRYDPIILNDELDISYHQREFQRLCQRLGDATESVIISFVDEYAKVKTDKIRPLSEGEMGELAGSFSHIAGEHGLTVHACCEAMDLTAYGIKPSACIDGELIRRITGKPLSLKPDRNQRPGCGCVASVDVGAYNTCGNGCVYCYANHSPVSVARNMARHDVAGVGLLP
jgi:hypothetical protein